MHIEADANERHLEGIRVLFVEDNDDTREIFGEFLQTYGAEVKTADCAESALATVAGWPPDVVLSDIGLPGDDGYTLMRRLRAWADERRLALVGVAFTAYSTAEDRRRAIDAGFARHVRKPVMDPELLARTLAEALRSARTPADRRSEPRRAAHAAHE